MCRHDLYWVKRKCHVNNLQAYLKLQVQFPVLSVCQVLYNGMLEWNCGSSVDCVIRVAAVECCGNLRNFETLMSLGPVSIHSNITINTRWESKILYITCHKNKKVVSNTFFRIALGCVHNSSYIYIYI